MKLALIYHQFIRSGGLENYLIEFATRMADAGHQLELVTAQIAPEVQAKLNAPVHRVPQVSGSKTLAMWQFARGAARLAHTLPVDVTIGFGRTYAHHLHRAGGGCHAIYSRLLPPWKRFALKNLLELRLEKRLYTSGETRRYITNSARVAAQLQGMYKTPAERFTTIHTAVDTDVFRPAPDRAAHRELACRKMQTDPAKPVLLFVSLGHRRKGLDALLAAMREVDATLWIAGRKLGRWYEAMIQSLGIAAKIRAIPVTNSLIDLYQAADWFVHPTLYDACANTVLQSMACGLPGIISVQDGAVDHVCDGMNGLMLFHPQDVAELTSRIHHALSLPADERTTMSNAAQETMQALTWERHLSEWEEALAAVK
ncbi:MAG: glycosyltransferase family 4 protein [Verrucomicrobiaceae bacterium]|nr:glycosyltransferase family 4 protein [Verrucomicrobiaceae bacterium]